MTTDNDPDMTHWMSTVSKATHHSLFKSRKTTGILYDTWIFDAAHAMAQRAGELQDEIIARVDRYRGESNTARNNGTPIPPPLGDFSSQLFNQLMISANGLMLQSAGSSPQLNSQPPAAAVEVMEWLGRQTPPKVAECIMAVDIQWPTDGTKCRISISMIGFALRSQVIQMMTTATGTDRQQGAPPPGTQERDLADYCRRFNRLTLEDEY